MIEWANCDRSTGTLRGITLRGGRGGFCFSIKLPSEATQLSSRISNKLAAEGNEHMDKQADERTEGAEDSRKIICFLKKTHENKGTSGGRKWSGRVLKNSGERYMSGDTQNDGVHHASLWASNYRTKELGQKKEGEARIEPESTGSVADSTGTCY